MGSKEELSIQSLLEYYHNEAVPALAAALTIDDEFPEEVLNEIRAAFTHLAAAQVNASDKEKVEYELAAARRHIRRVCLDCLKVCIFSLAQKSERAIDALTDDIQLPSNVYKEMSRLRNQRKRLAALEGERKIEDAIAEYKALFNEHDKFYVSLDENFAGDSAELRRRARRRRDYWGWGIAFVIGIAASYIASYLWALLPIR